MENHLKNLCYYQERSHSNGECQLITPRKNTSKPIITVKESLTLQNPITLWINQVLLLLILITESKRIKTHSESSEKTKKRKLISTLTYLTKSILLFQIKLLISLDRQEKPVLPVLISFQEINAKMILMKKQCHRRKLPIGKLIKNIQPLKKILSTSCLFTNIKHLMLRLCSLCTKTWDSKTPHQSSLVKNTSFLRIQI